MHRVLALAAAIGLAAAVLTPSTALAGGVPTTTTYVSVTCFVDWTDVHYRLDGRDGQTEHDSAVITNELWIYDASGWRMVGTEVDAVKAETNYWAGVELFRGTFTVESTLGDFAGSFVWLEGPSGAGGHGQGHATDGSGLLWKSTAGVVDPTASGVPACAAQREVYNLTRLEVTRP